ncbi:hypothetical protein B0H14DRAFT_3450496 [Mycena olivaceomarginata]|nr:hypothetical protein B0H14DRAFT_3450496 [Mycena olivaceomarginata]
MSIIQVLVANTFSIPPRTATTREPLRVLCADGSTVVLPSTYCMPLLWVAKLLWSLLETRSCSLRRNTRQNGTRTNMAELAGNHVPAMQLEQRIRVLEERAGSQELIMPNSGAMEYCHPLQHLLSVEEALLDVLAMAKSNRKFGFEGFCSKLFAFL